jgi:arsenate reductase-like glutaredoxin family protein
MRRYIESVEKGQPNYEEMAPGLAAAVRAGMTFRKLPDKDKAGISEKKAIALMLAQPSMIKRPVLDLGGGKLVVGFKPELYDAKVARA